MSDERRAELCTTHHHACDCREYAHARTVADLIAMRERNMAEVGELRAERDALREANDSLVRWKGYIDQRRVLLHLPFPEDYDNSPMFAINSLIDAEIDAAND